MIIGCGLFFAFIVPPDLGSTLLRGYKFFQHVSTGYNMGWVFLSFPSLLRNSSKKRNSAAHFRTLFFLFFLHRIQSLPPSRRTAGGSMEYVISEYVQWFYDMPWESMRASGVLGNLKEKLTGISRFPEYALNARDMSWYVLTKAKKIPYVGTAIPPEYFFPTDNRHPRTFFLSPSQSAPSPSGKTHSLCVRCAHPSHTS